MSDQPPKKLHGLAAASPETRSAVGRAGRAKSPWNKGPMCLTHKAIKTRKEYQERKG